MRFFGSLPVRIGGRNAVPFALQILLNGQLQRRFVFNQKDFHRSQRWRVNPVGKLWAINCLHGQDYQLPVGVAEILGYFSFKESFVDLAPTAGNLNPQMLHQ